MKRILLKAFSNLVYVLGGWHVILLLDRVLSRRHHLVALVYHHLGSDDDRDPAVSDLGRGTPVSVFERHLRLLQPWYAPMTMDGLNRILDGEDELQRDALLVTFDDGYRDNWTLGGPCLRRHGFPGVIFIATDYIESPRRFWWVWLDDILRDMSPADWTSATTALAGPESARSCMRRLDLNDWQGRQRARAEMEIFLRAIAPEECERVVNHLVKYANSAAPTSLPLVSWSDMRQMQQEGFIFGGHTHTHPRLSQLAESEIQRELDENATLLQKNLGRPPLGMAYPFGDYSAAVARETSRSAFQLAFTTKPGTIVPGQASRHELPRISIWRSSRGEIALTIVTLKATKHFPRLARPLLGWLLGVSL